MNKQKPSILVGIDFSAGSELALTTAVALAQRLGASLHVVHVFEPLTAIPTEAPRFMGIEAQLESEKLRQRNLCTELCERLVADRVECAIDIIEAMALDGLLEAIEKLKPELVVVGSHGRGVLKRMLLGSVSTALCKHSPVPVVVVPTAAQAPRSEAQRDPKLFET